MNPAASSFANSFLMASRLSGEKHHSRCFFGVALGSTIKACSINSLGTPSISAGFHANTSRLALRKLMSSSSYLSSKPAPMMAVLESSPSCSWIVAEVDLCTSLPSGVPEPGRLPCSVTRLRLLGMQDSAVSGNDLQWIRMRGSS